MAARARLRAVADGTFGNLSLGEEEDDVGEKMLIGLLY